MSEKTNLFQRIFGLGINRKTYKPADRVFKTKEVPNDIGGFDTVREKFSPIVNSLFNYWVNNCYLDIAKYEGRKSLYLEMDSLWNNYPLIQRAMKMYADETIQADVNNQLIGVESTSEEQQQFILDFLTESGVEEYLWATALSIVKYGDAGWILSLGDRGVQKIVPISIHDLEARLEFTPYQVRQDLYSGGTIVNQMTQNFDRMRLLADSIAGVDEYMSYFDSYLFGFQIGNFIVPPWRFIHFRNYVTDSPFKPFGMPLFLHAIAPAKQLSAAMTLHMAARSASIPIEKYEINLPNPMPASEKLRAVLDFIRQLDNIGLRESTKEGAGIGERIITIKELFDFDQISPNIDLGNISELELLRDELVVATGIPRNMLDPNNGSFGNSGIALLTQFRPFARAVYQIQSIMLKQLTHLVKIHLIQSGRFSLDEVDFKLTMPYPESQVDGEVIRSQTDLLGLVGTILDTLQERLLGDSGGELPPEVIKQVFTQILPWDDSRIKNWVDKTLEVRSSSKSDDENNDLFREGRKILKEIGQKPLENMIKTAIWEEKQKRFREGVSENRHFYSSRVNPNSEFDLSLFEKAQKQKLTKLQEELRLEETEEESL